MKKIVFLSLGLLVCAGSESSMSAYSRTKEPISQTCAVLGTTAIGAGVWGLTKLFAANAAGVGMGVGSHGLHVGFMSFFHPMSDNWSTVIATGAALLGAYIGWKSLSSYTADGYARCAREIMSGDTCSQPEVYDLVQQAQGDAQKLADNVVTLFAAQKNEHVKAVNALEELFNQLSLASHYFDVAKKDSNCRDTDLMEGLQEIIGSHLAVIRGASLIIKAFPDFERQSNAELQEMSVQAQYATASAIRSAGYASHANYSYNIN
jgi:hypothetical protein